MDMEDFDPSSDDNRTHFIDNLRSTLTVLLIVQHSIIETASSLYPSFNSIPLTLFVFITKTVLVGLFFFVSGYAASISRTASSSAYSYHSTGRSDPEFLWRRTVRLLFPGIAYGVLGHVILWMVLSESWPSFFGGAGSIPMDDRYPTSIASGFARFQGPVVHILLLYAMDVAYVALRPARKGEGVVSGGGVSASRTTPRSRSDDSNSGLRSPPTRMRKNKRYRLVRIKSKRGWYTLSGIALGLLSLWTFAVVASGRSEKSWLRFGFNVASYDAIVPAAPFQHILAYMAGIQLYQWQKHMLIPSPYTFPAFFLALFSSIFLLLFGMHTSPTFREIVHVINAPWPVHPSFIDGGFNYHTIFFAFWNAFSFFGISATVVSVYAQWEWTRRDWGFVARHSYVPVWVHMIPVVVFVKLLGADGGAAPALAEENVGWRCFLVATGSVICSWFAGLAVAGFWWGLGL